MFNVKPWRPSKQIFLLWTSLNSWSCKKQWFSTMALLMKILMFLAIFSSDDLTSFSHFNVWFLGEYAYVPFMSIKVIAQANKLLQTKMSPSFFFRSSMNLKKPTLKMQPFKTWSILCPNKWVIDDDLTGRT